MNDKLSAKDEPLLVSTLSASGNATNETGVRRSSGSTSITCPPGAVTAKCDARGASADEAGWVAISFYDQAGELIERVTVTRP